MKVDNAIIMAAGTSSRFAPLSFEKHKALTIVKGEILIERQIKQLKEAGVLDIYIVTGYKAEQFNYLEDKYGIKLVHNAEYLTRNNNGSIWTVRNILKNSYVCSSDNYFLTNPFEIEVDDAYYAAEYSDGFTNEWCMTEDANGYIDSVSIGGRDAWYMLGHTFWSKSFSEKFLKILESEYELPETKDLLWERIFMKHTDSLKMRIKKYEPGIIFEFDTLDDLRNFDDSYIDDSHSVILKNISKELNIKEKDIIAIKTIKGDTTESIGFEFIVFNKRYVYIYETKRIEKAEENNGRISKRN